MIVYRAINHVNGMSYIGQTTRSLDTRRKCHERKDDKSYFQHAIEKYGRDNFKWEVLCECDSSDDMNEKEMYYIKLYNTLRPNGYNLTLGGEGSYWTGENNPAKLLHIREKISAKNLGNKRPDLTAYNKGLTGLSYDDIYGVDRAIEIKSMMSCTRKGRKLPNRTPEHNELFGVSRSRNDYFITKDCVIYGEFHATKPISVIIGIPNSKLLYRLGKSDVVEIDGYTIIKIPNGK